MSLRLAVTCSAAFLLTTGVASGQRQEAEGPALNRAAVAPEFSLVDLDGRPQNLSQYRGRVVLIDFWAVWCGPCWAEAPTLNVMYRKYQDAGLVIIGIAPDPTDKIREFTTAAGHGWPQVAETDNGPVHRLFRVTGYPTHVLIGRDGRIVARHVGGVEGTGLERQVSQALRQKP